MNDVRDSAKRLVDAMRAVQCLQTEYDKEGWDINEPAFAKLRHIQIHLSIALGRFASFCEPYDHKMLRSDTISLEADNTIPDVVADLVYHAAQIADIFDLDIASCSLDRYRRNASRFCAGGSFASQIET